MKYLDEYRDPELAQRLFAEIRRITTRPWAIMEVCGGQTHSIIESTAKRVGHRSGAAFTAEDARASRSNASRFAVHIFEVLCAPGVSAVRFCSEVNHEKRKAPHWRGLHGGAAQSITPRGLCACYQLLTSGTIRP